MGLDFELGGQGFARPYRHQTLALQAVQAPPLAPEYPPLHTHACKSLDPW